MCLGIAADAVCCAGVSFCSCACCCCKSCCGSTFKEQIKLSYIILNIVMMTFTVICLYWIQQFFAHYAGIFECQGNPYCLGVSAVYRMSFVLACFYLILLFLMTFRGEVAKIANQDFFGLKILFIIVFFIGSLYIPNTFFDGYVDFARVISFLYLIFQIIMLIDVFYLWGQNWIAGYESGNQLYCFLLIFVTMILYGGAITLNVFNFIWFDGCSLNVFMNVFTIILIITITVVQLLGWNPQGSLLCSGAIAFYITYQSYSAQASANSSAVMSVETVLGFIMCTIALLYLTFATKENSSNVIKVGQNNAVTAGFLESQQEKDEDEEQQQKIQQQNQQIQQIQTQQQNTLLSQEEELAKAKELVKKEELAPYQGNQYIIFHSVMFITVVFMAMMITNWGSPDLQAGSLSFQPSELSYWVKIICSWLGALLYIWTLIAPHIFPDREF